MEKLADITALVLTKDGERLLGKCLASLEFCGRILVVDSESTDSTQEIAAQAGAEVMVRPWPGPVDQFRFALEQISSQWVLSLDQDEWLDKELIETVKATIQSPPQADVDLAGYYLNRRSYYFDRFLSHSGWYPDPLLRLFRLGHMEVTASGPHYSFQPQGRTRRLKAGDILHVPYKDLAEHWDKMNSYTSQAAADLRAKGKKGGLLSAMAHGLGRFFKVYVMRRGFLDGKAGFILALHAFFYGFHKYLRAAEPKKEPEEFSSPGD
ncbi:MAG: glycosyltransferase family 2 protein [Desulfovibrio sp.]|nr:MAG: glycosyltransferase family 2 protein [Desulfovibrio sp.]